MELCRQLGCKTYINGNVGSGTVQEMSEWVEYMTFDGVSPMADLRAKRTVMKSRGRLTILVSATRTGAAAEICCQSSMRMMYRRYQTYVRNYDNATPVAKICLRFKCR